MTVIDKRIIISMQHQAEAGHRPAIGGVGLGPWLDEGSARFLVQWLTLCGRGAADAVLSLLPPCPIQEAIGLATDRKFWPEPPAPEADRPRSVLHKPRRGMLARKLRQGGHR